MPEICPVDFWTHYSYLCLKSQVCPLRSVIKHLKGTELCFQAENIRRDHWPYLLSALTVDQSLTKIWFWSKFPIAEYKEISEEKKKKSNLLFPIPYGCTAKNITDICKCVSQLLHNSKTLKVLMIENIFLRDEDIQNLSEGLKNSNIEKFSLAGCQLQDEYIENLCRGLQSSTVSWIDFSMCGLGTSGTTYICDLIKALHRKRSCDMFPETLRYRLPILDDMKGLRRVSLNSNPIGDKGVEILMNSLEEDIWMKALDLQKCNIENEGAKSILKILRTNVGLQLLDLRQNKIDTTLIDRIALQLSLNNTQKEIKFNLGDLWKPPKFEKAVKRRIAKTRSVKHAVISRPGSYASMGKKLKASMCLLKKIEKTHIEDTEKKNSETFDAYSQTTDDFNDELNEMKNALLHEMRVQNSMKQLVKKYKVENSLLRKELDKMAVLENYILIDHETFVEVTNIFEKFKRFLEAMKKYGLWDCIEMMGVSEKSDIALKPYIIDTTRKCMKLVESDSPSIKKSDSASSSIPATTKHIPTEQPQTYSYKHKNKPKDVDEFQEQASRISQQIQEKIYAKAPPPPQSKVMKVFMDVRDNYSKSILSSQVSEGRKNDHIHHYEDDYKQSKRLHHSKLTRSNKYNLISREEVPGKTKSVASQTPLVKTTSHKQKSSSTSHKTASQKVTVPKIIQSSTSVSDISSEVPSPVYEHSINESLRSSEYKSLPTSQSVPKERTSRRSEISQSLKLSQGAGDHIFNPPLHSDKGLSTDSESTLRSSKKLTSVKSSHHGDSYSHRSVKAKTADPYSHANVKPRTAERVTSHETSPKTRSSSPVLSISSYNSRKKVESDSSGGKGDAKVKPRTVEHVTSHETSPKSKSSSPVSSISSYNSRKKVKSDSSGGKGDSYKSYLESVSDGSTDKDFKSLSLSEVYSSSKDKRDSDHSDKFAKAKVSSPDKVPLKDSLETKSPNGKERPLETVPILDEKLSQVSKGSIQDSSPKPTKYQDSQVKHGPPHPEKPLKRNDSEASIPSLSDITTVSSKSLNTDSVMGKLSDN